jgi:hypothetical protein
MSHFRDLNSSGLLFIGHLQGLIGVLNPRNQFFHSSLCLPTMSFHRMANKVERAGHHCDITSILGHA